MNFSLTLARSSDVEGHYIVRRERESCYLKSEI